MTNVLQIPAGLLDSDIEFFNDPKDPERCFCLTEGQVSRINHAPPRVLDLIDGDMRLFPIKIEALVEIGYETAEAQREKYCSCCFGAFDGRSDVVDGVFRHGEYWNCPHRGVCPVEGRLCDGLLVGEGKTLTRREIDVLIEVAGNCALDKEVADRLGISEETVKIHKKHIYEKSGLQTKMDLIKLAFNKNLIS